MGLLQKAVETYDSHLEYASANRTDSVMMAPVGHIVTRAEIEIALDCDGKFINAISVDNSEPKIIIPATESSAGRTSAPCAHPLCEQIGYLTLKNKIKYKLYTEQLSGWAKSEFGHPKLSAVLTYVLSGTILEDLCRCGIISQDAQEISNDEKRMVRWRIVGEEIEECWLDRSLFDAFTGYYAASYTGFKTLCMISGEEIAIAGQHPKGIIPINGNAKLISANDSSGFTYRGRFNKEWQAAGIGYEASQKAHNALRWLVQEQGVTIGGRTFLCWNPQGRSIVMPMHPLMKRQRPVFKPSDYRDELKKALHSKKSELKLTDGVVVAVFDAATTGRLSLTYYNELQGHDFLQRLHDWDVSCCWNDRIYGIESPSLRQIVDCAFGTQRGEKGAAHMETDERVVRQQMQRLISCRIDKVPIGRDIVKALIDKASKPLGYERNVREKMLFTACAVIRKYRYDRFKEEWSMALEPERRDRSYQFGRLLAIMEKVERDTYGDNEGREPNAIRMQSVFCQRPMNTANQIQKQLDKAYFPRLRENHRGWYKKLIGQVMDIISTFPDEEWNKPLGDTYLMGYYLQRNSLYTKNNNDTTEENEND